MMTSAHDATALEKAESQKVADIFLNDIMGGEIENEKTALIDTQSRRIGIGLGLILLATIILVIVVIVLLV